MSFDALLESRFKTDPWQHQMREFELSADLPSRALLWQMRTGKSKEIVDQACSLYLRGRIDAVLIFAPNGVHENWVEREFPTHAWDSVDELNTFAWRTRISGVKAKDAAPLLQDLHAAWHADVQYATAMGGLLVATFNSESVIRDDVRKVVKRLLKKRRCLVIWDESSDYRSPGSARHHMARSIALVAPYRRILDGTVITSTPMAAFAQFELLEKKALGFATFHGNEHEEGFKNFFGEWEQKRRGGPQGRAYPSLVAFKNLDILRDRMAAHSSVVLRTDCEDLPGLIPRRRKIPLSPEQKRIYKEVETATRIEIDAGEVVTINAKTIRLQKLQQVLGGWLIGEDKKPHLIPGPTPRMDALADEVYWCSGPVIVWAQFQHEIKAIIARLRAEGHEVWHYYGGSSDKDKAKVRAEFPTLDRKVVLVAQCQSAGRGLLLPCSDIFWYSHTFMGIFRQQGNERGTVMGGDAVNLVDFVAPGVDSYILDTVTRRVEIADDVAGRGLQEILNRYSLANTENKDAY